MNEIAKTNNNEVAKNNNAGVKAPIVLGDFTKISKLDLINITNDMNTRQNNNLIFNTVFSIKAIIIDRKKVQSKFNNEIVECPVIAFITEDNKTMITFSNGIEQALKNIISIWGKPPYKDFNMIFTEEKTGRGTINNVKLVPKIEDIPADDEDLPFN